MKKEYKKPSLEILLLYAEEFVAESDNVGIGGDDDELDPSLGESRKKTWDSKLWGN